MRRLGVAGLALAIGALSIVACGDEEAPVESSATGGGVADWDDGSEGVSFERSHAVAAKPLGGAPAIVNGGFESGFTGWTTAFVGSGYRGDPAKTWLVGDLDNNLYGGIVSHTEDLAQSGSAGASAVESGSTYHSIYQDVAVPSGSGVELRFWMRWKNFHGTRPSGGWIAPRPESPLRAQGQDVVVTLREPSSGSVLATIMQASSEELPYFSGDGTPEEAAYVQRVADISAFAGQTVRLQFENYVCCWYQFMDIDDIQVEVLDPQTKSDCKDGGWEAYGFRNQGQCVRFVGTGKDSRE